MIIRICELIGLGKDTIADYLVNLRHFRKESFANTFKDARTVYKLYPGLPKPPTSHHALEDCRRQIDMLQATLAHLNIKELA